MKKLAFSILTLISFFLTSSTVYSQFSIGPSIGAGASYFNIISGGIGGSKAGCEYNFVAGFNAKYSITKNNSISLISHYSAKKIFPNTSGGCFPLFYGEMTYQNINNSILFNAGISRNLYLGIGTNITHWFNFQLSTYDNNNNPQLINYNINQTMLGLSLSPSYEYRNVNFSLLYNFYFKRFIKNDSVIDYFSLSNNGSPHYLQLSLAYFIKL